MYLAIKVEPNKTKLDAILASGTNFVEVFTIDKYIDQEYVVLLKSYPFKYSVHAPVKYCDDSVFDFAEILGAKTVTIHCTYTFAELEKLANNAVVRGLKLCIENEGVFGDGNYEDDLDKPSDLKTVHTAQDFLELRSQLPNLSMTFDNEHSDMRGTTDSFWPLIGAGLIQHMHVSGYDGTRGSWHSQPLNNPARFEETIRNAKMQNYQGMLTVEMHMRHHTEDVFRKHREFFDRIDQE